MRKSIDPVDQEVIEERHQALVEMLNSDGWRHVARPGIAAAMHQIARTLVVSRNANLETIRALQAEFAVLARLVENPKSFFLFAGKARQEETHAALETSG